MCRYARLPSGDGVYLGELLTKQFKVWDDDIVFPEFPTIVHKMTFEECEGLGFDENTANIIAYIIDPKSWRPMPGFQIIDALDALTGQPAGLKKKAAKKDKLKMMRLGYSFVMFFTPPRLRPLSGMKWMMGLAREAQAPGKLCFFACMLVCRCDSVVSVSQAGKMVRRGPLRQTTSYLLSS